MFYKFIFYFFKKLLNIKFAYILPKKKLSCGKKTEETSFSLYI